MSEPGGKTTRIAIFGHFDGTNFGNEATLQAVLYNLRRIEPGGEVTCICTGPQMTAAAHHIRAIPVARTYLKSWAPRDPIGRFVRKICLVMGEPVRWSESIINLWGTDIFLVPGTGLLTDAYGILSWGPYNLLRWSLVAKLCRCRLVFISVGAGPFFSGAGKFFVKSLLSMADFRSYRDKSTVDRLRGVGMPVGEDQLFPDLAFSLPKRATSPERRPIGPGAVIGLGVMEHPGRYGEQRPGDAAQMDYLQALVETAKWLLARGYNIRLLIGDLADIPAKEMFLQLLAQDGTTYDRGRIIDEPIRSFEDLMSQLAETDAVIATRFHNILLSLFCEKPVIAISFHHKCNSLMAAMGMSEYCLGIRDLDPDALIGMFRRLEMNADELKPAVHDRVESFRDALDQQYELVLNSI